MTSYSALIKVFLNDLKHSTFTYFSMKMISLISQECIGQCGISKKRKRLAEEVEVFESITKRPRHWISNEDGSTEQLFTTFSSVIDVKAISEIWGQLDLFIKSMSDSVEISDSYRLLTDCIETVNVLNNMDPLVQLSNGTLRSHRPPIRKQLAYFVEDRFYFEKI